MLSIFYVIRTFDFRAMEMYQIYNTKIFSGKNLEYLEIEYLGQEILKQNKKEYSTYKWQNAVQAENVDFRNCVMYNAQGTCYGGPGGGQINIVNNSTRLVPAIV